MSEYARLGLERMQAAIQLYERFGFVRCAPYYVTPLADTVSMELSLGS